MKNQKEINMPEILRTDSKKIEQYPDHVKTNPQAKGDIDSIEKNLYQDNQKNLEYPDHLKTKPEH